MFQTKFVEKIKTHILCSITFFPKVMPFMRNVTQGFCGFFQSFQAHARIISPRGHDRFLPNAPQSLSNLSFYTVCAEWRVQFCNAH
jgi:hypothetical protein